MKTFRSGIGERFKRVDSVLMICMLILSLMGLLTLVGGLDTFGTRRLTMQLSMTVLGIFLVIFIANLDYKEIVDKLYIVVFLCSVFILAATLLFGLSAGTNKSWLIIYERGNTVISIQPSEFVKATFIMTFAKHLDLVKDKINKFKTVLGLGLHVGIIVGLIFLSGDLGVMLVYVGIVAVMLFCAGLNALYFVGAAVGVVLIFPYLWPYLDVYQRERILVGFNPDSDPLGYGLQPIMGRSAIANGGFWGRGFFGGEYYKTLPAAETDFIFATFCEKFGFVGAFVVIAVLIIMVIRIVMIAKFSSRDYGSFICAGVLAMIVVQSIENIGMCLAMLPVVGITLPFMSAGGSSVLAIYITIGMVHAVSAYRKKFFFVEGGK